jgi:hypothetical protein
MTKRRAALAGVTMAGAVALTGGLLWLAVPADTVTEENYRRVMAGMSLAEVEAIFGGPADRTEPGWPVIPVEGEAAQAPTPMPVTARAWLGRGYAVHLMFDAGGRVIQHSGYARDPGPWHRRLADLLGL